LYLWILQPRIAEVLVENPFSQDRLDQYLLEWIVKDDQPFTQLQSKDFIRILTLLKPNVKVISADTVKRRIMAEFEVKQNELKNLLINLDSNINYKVSFTTDCWTSSNNIAFMGRNSLSASTILACQCLKSWYKSTPNL
jgi:hypothetical protein